MKNSIEQSLRRAKAFARQGEAAAAAEIYHEILSAYPNNKRARSALAKLTLQPGNAMQERLNRLATLFQQGLVAEMTEGAQALVQEFPDSPLGWNVLGIGNGQLKNYAASEEAFIEATRIAPDFSDAHYNLGTVLQTQGKLDRAADSYRKTLALTPHHVECHNNLGAVLQAQGETDEAIKSFRRAIQLEPRFPDACENLANALRSTGDGDGAIEYYKKVLSVSPNRPNLWELLGGIYREQERYDLAVASYRHAIELDSARIEAYIGLGLAQQDRGELDNAIQSFQHALELNPQHQNAHNNLGAVFRAQGQLENAVKSYQLALELDPDHANALNNLGNVLQEMGRYADAEYSYRNALSLNPDDAHMHFNLANALQEQGRLDEAVKSFDQALRLDPDHSPARADKLHQQALMCDWKYIKEFQQYAASLGTGDDAVAPFAMLSKEDHPGRQKMRSEAWTRNLFLSGSPREFEIPAQRPSKLRIGYFSADFHDHPVMYLMSGVFKHHDRNRFELIAYSYGGEKQDTMRETLVTLFDDFRDIHGIPDGEIADLARQDRLDIAVDMTGYTGNSRSSLFASRLAPVQINFPGFASTMGAEFIDYMISDVVSIPEDQRQHYTEKLLYLPDCYLPYDNSLLVAETSTTRRDFDLPENGFVFCCFNNSYKIGPREFDIWMRLLRESVGSVLWLFRSNSWAEDNLRREAGARGIAGERLVFAERLPHDQHLARHKHADLFLDTFNFNAHATASDALWAGLPVLTLTGQQLVARLASSLLQSAGLQELVTYSEEAYENLATALSSDRKQLADIRTKLGVMNKEHALFDTGKNTRALEAAYKSAYSRYFAGLPPATTVIETSDR